MVVILCEICYFSLSFLLRSICLEFFSFEIVKSYFEIVESVDKQLLLEKHHHDYPKAELQKPFPKANFMKLWHHNCSNKRYFFITYTHLESCYL